MVGAVEHVQVFDNFAAQTVFGKHAFDYAEVEGVHAGLEVLVEGFLHEHFGGELALTAGIAGEVVVDAVGPLVAGKLNFVGVDDDHVVAALNEGRVAWLVLAAQNFGHFGAESAEHQVGGVDEDPFLRAVLRVGCKGFVT